MKNRLPSGLLSDPISTAHAPTPNRQSQTSDTYGICSPQSLTIDSSLLQKGCTGCARIFAIFDSVGGDVFFVNSAMLSYKLDGSPYDFDPVSGCRPLCSASIKLRDATLISLDKPLRVLESLPEPLVSLLSYLQVQLAAAPGETRSDKRVSDVPPLLVLPSSNLSPYVQVPLAGILLDYSFAYIPPAQAEPQDNNVFLPGEALDVFEISLRSSETTELLELMKFSCPSEFSNPGPPATSTLPAIHDRLAPIIEHLNSNMDGGKGPGWEIVSNVSHVTLDRVAL